MVLAHRRSKSTLDVDPLVIDPRGTVLQAAVDVAREQSLPADWLNDEVTKIAILPYRPDSKAQVLFDSPYLVVTGASARHMLAMKVRTGCSRDEDDIKLLLRRLKVKTLQQVRGVHQAAYPYDGIPWRSEERVKDLIRIVWEQRGQGGQPPSHAQEGDGGTDR